MKLWALLCVLFVPLYSEGASWVTSEPGSCKCIEVKKFETPLETPTPVVVVPPVKKAIHHHHWKAKKATWPCPSPTETATIWETVTPSSTPTVEVYEPTPAPTVGLKSNTMSGEKFFGSFNPEKRVHLGVRFGQHLFESDQLPNGFSYEKTGSFNEEIFLLFKLTERIGVEFSGYANPFVAELHYYSGPNSSLGKKRVMTLPSIMAILYPFKEYLYFGYGWEYTTVEGNYSVGGVNFAGSNTDWSPTFRAGLDLILPFHFKRVEYMIGGDFKMSKVSLSSTISKGDYSLKDTGFISINALAAF